MYSKFTDLSSKHIKYSPRFRQLHLVITLLCFIYLHIFSTAGRLHFISPPKPKAAHYNTPLSPPRIIVTTTSLPIGAAKSNVPSATHHHHHRHTTTKWAKISAAESAKTPAIQTRANFVGCEALRGLDAAYRSFTRGYFDQGDDGLFFRGVNGE